MPKYEMPLTDYMVLCLKLHTELHHAIEQNCYDLRCAGRFLLIDHPRDWGQMTTEEIASWARLRTGR